MKPLVAFIFLCLLSVPSFGQAESAVNARIDTMRKHVPSGLPENVYIKDIIIKGNKQTRRSIILREMNVSPGMVLPSKDLAYFMSQNKIRIINLALFDDIEMDIEPLTGDSVIWHIRLKERWYIFPEVSLKLADRNFNVWWYEQNHDIKRAILGVALTHSNFRGNMEKLSLIGQVGYSQRFGINYQRPYIDKNQKHGIGISMFDSRNRETFYRTDSNKLEFARAQDRDMLHIFETYLTYTYRPAYNTKHLLQLSYRDFTVDDSIRRLNSDYFYGSNRARFMELVYRLELNRVDNWNYPLVGTKLIGLFTNRFGLSGFSYQSFINLELGTYHNFARKWYWDAVFKGRIMLPEKPPYGLFGATGMGSSTDYLRGYEYYVVDGPQYGLIRTDLKYELLNFTIKGIPIPFLKVIPIRLYPKIFADFGGSRNPYPGTSRLNNRLLYSGGFGIDILSAYEVRLRIEYSFNHLGENGLFLHNTTK
jgi:outer membrane protein assembly factor BamA